MPSDIISDLKISPRSPGNEVIRKQIFLRRVLNPPSEQHKCVCETAAASKLFIEEEPVQTLETASFRPCLDEMRIWETTWRRVLFGERLGKEMHNSQRHF